MTSLLIRPVTMEDCEATYALSMDPVVRSASIREDPFTIDQHREWLAARLADKRCRYWVAYENARLVAQIRYAKTAEAQPTAEVSIAVSPDRRGRGLGSAMLSVTERWSRDALGVALLSALIRPENTPSLRLFTNAGYQFCGSTGRMGKTLAAYEKRVA